MRDIERRTVMGSVEVRGEGDERRIVGYAAKFNKRSVDLGGFVEEIAPGAFDRALREAHDVRALVDHNPSMILGRTTSGTLSLAVDAEGLRSEIKPPDTQAGRDIQVSLERRDVTGMSFGFRVLEGGDEWSSVDMDEGMPKGKKMPKKMPMRVIRDLELFDVSVVTFPAYPDTEVSMRALEHAQALAAPVPPLERHTREIGLLDRFGDD